MLELIIFTLLGLCIIGLFLIAILAIDDYRLRKKQSRPIVRTHFKDTTPKREDYGEPIRINTRKA
jgi:hypothetical protein